MMSFHASKVNIKSTLTTSFLKCFYLRFEICQIFSQREEKKEAFVQTTKRSI